MFANKSIEVAVESAQLDFDSASQQECQDILDSVDPIRAVEEPNIHTSYLDSVKSNSAASLDNSIPQLDGSSDENPKVSQEYDRSKVTRKSVVSASYTSTKKPSKSASKYSGTEHLWGSLPLSSRKKRQHGDADDSCSAMSPQKDLSASKKSTIDKDYHDTIGSTDSESSSFLGVHDSVCHSVRDLMRRRRSFRREQLEFGCSGAATCTMDKESETVNSGGLEFHDFTSDIPNLALTRMAFVQKPPLKDDACSGLESPSDCEQRGCKYPRNLYVISMNGTPSI